MTRRTSDERRHCPALTKRWCICILVVTYLALAIPFGILTRAWEADDEQAHTQYVEYIVRHHAIPHISAANGWESHQPPLYYLLVAQWQHLLEIPAFSPQVISLPTSLHSATDALPLGHNYTPAEHRDAIYLRWLRLLSVLMGLGTVLLSYGVAKVFGMNEAGALSVGLFVALLPRELVISSAVTNDALVVPLCALGLLLFLLSERARVSARVGRRRLYITSMGLVLGAAAITKFSSLPVAAVLIILAMTPAVSRSRLRNHPNAVVPEPGDTLLRSNDPALHATARLPRPTRDRLSGLKVEWGIVLDGGIAVVAFTAMSGWWFIRNNRLYGQVLATKVSEQYLRGLTLNLLHPVPWRLSIFTNEIPATFRASMWYLQPNLELPAWMNDALGVLALVALVAGAWTILANRRASTWSSQRGAALALLGCIGAGITSVVLIIKSVGYSDARLSYVALAPIAAVMVVGATRLTRIKIQLEPIGLMMWPTILLAVDVYVLVRFLIPLGGL